MLQLTAISANESWSLDRWHQFILALLVFTFSKLWKQNLPGHKAPVRMCQKRESSLYCNTTGNLTWKKKPQLTVFYYSCVQGSYWAIDTNPKEDALPTRPKKRPRSGERVSIRRTNAAYDFLLTTLCLKLIRQSPVHLCMSVYPPLSPTRRGSGVHIQTLCNCLSMQPVVKWGPYY